MWLSCRRVAMFFGEVVHLDDTSFACVDFLHQTDRQSDARYQSLRREMEVAMRLDQEGVGAVQVTMESVFERNRLKVVEDYMAEEMEIVLESYGQIATRRVLDRIP